MARAGLRRLSVLAATAVVVAGILPDIDFLSIFGGPRAYLALHRTITHSIPGGLVLALLVAFVLWRLGHRLEPVPARFPSLFLAAVCGIAGHLLLDLGDSYGERIFWPFSNKWYALNLWPQLDPWLLLLLLLVLGVPWLLSIVGEEMGASRRRGVSLTGILALLLIAGYCVWRARLHDEAVALLYSNTYHGAEPLSVAAYPLPMSPFDWRGVINTYNSVDVVPIRVGPNPDFEPDMALTHYKIPNSPALQAAEHAFGIAAWRNFARYPFVEIESTETGSRVTFRDLRYDHHSQFWTNPTVAVDLDKSNRVLKTTWRFGLPR